MNPETSTPGGVTPPITGEYSVGGPPAHDSRKNIMLAGGVLIAGGLVMGIVFYFGILSFLFLSGDVRNLSYVDESGTLLTPGYWSFKKDITYSAFDDVLAVQKGASADVAVVRSPEGVVDVALYPHGGTVTLITNGQEREEVPAVSQDGNHVAYAVFRSTVKNVVSSSNITEWRVMLWSKESGEVIDLGVGYNPSFVDGDTVLMTTLDGLSLYSMGTGTVTQIPLSVDGMVGGTAELSGDGKYVVIFDPKTTVYNVYSLAGSVLNLVSTVDATGITSLTSRGSVLYVLTKSGDDMNVRKSSFGADMKLSRAFMLPGTPVINSIY